MTLRILQCTERTIPWGNGLGASRELAGGVLQGDVSWRLSTTSIDASCPFSFYPGLERTIVLLAGEGFELDHGPHGRNPVAPPLGSARFSGEWETYCTLNRGRVDVMNAVVASSLRHELALRESGTFTAESGSVCVLHALEGAAVIDAAGQRIELNPNETICLLPGAPLHVEVDCDRMAVLMVDRYGPSYRNGN